MKKGLKLTLQITAILLVVAVIGVGIYWLVVHNNSTQALANSGFDGGGRHGGHEGLSKGALPDGNLSGLGADRHNGQNGINLASRLWTAGRILLEIGVVTLGVLLVQWLIRKMRKPKLAVAVASPSSGDAPAPVSQAAPVELAEAAAEPEASEGQDLFPPDPPEEEKTE